MVLACFLEVLYYPYSVICACKKSFLQARPVKIFFAGFIQPMVNKEAFHAESKPDHVAGGFF